MSTPKPALVKDPNAAVTWVITGIVLGFAVLLMIIMPLVAGISRLAQQGTQYQPIVADLTRMVDQQPMYDSNVSGYHGGTFIGDSGGTHVEHFVVYAGDYTTVIPPVVRELAAQGYNCDAAIDEEGNSIDSYTDPGGRRPPIPLDYKKITTDPGSFDPAVIAHCVDDRRGGGRGANYWFYSTKYNGKPAIVVYLS